MEAEDEREMEAEDVEEREYEDEREREAEDEREMEAEDQRAEEFGREGEHEREAENERVGEERAEGEFGGEGEHEKEREAEEEREAENERDDERDAEQERETTTAEGKNREAEATADATAKCDSMENDNVEGNVNGYEHLLNSDFLSDLNDKEISGCRTGEGSKYNWLDMNMESDEGEFGRVVEIVVVDSMESGLNVDEIPLLSPALEGQEEEQSGEEIPLLSPPVDGQQERQSCLLSVLQHEQVEEQEEEQPRSRRQRKTKLSVVLSEDYDQTWRRRSLNKDKLFELMLKCKENPVIIKCDGHTARLSSCKSVAQARGRVDDNYVRVVACLYSKVWRKRFGNRSCRLMMDPTFAVSSKISVNWKCVPW
ncbi:uncharacterized protein LOC125496771 [Beta vulgaris subsp. vulgaris]|uniref:uncharacterized protein LOC125496771 n=1 Tax=Beta vulgaris subsp. vulgaris TaxID=3555 RepID=UPI002036698E|nr:uncharacterized protein LOC125496771 [Beta vulgaris subsp. vulgaris]